MMRNSLLGLVALLFAASCGTALRVTPLNPPPRRMEPRAFEDVKIFRQPPQQRYVEVYQLFAEQQSEFSMHRPDQVFNNLRARAARLGCDGILVQGRSQRMVHAEEGAFVLQGFRATCIVLTGGK